MKFRLTYTVLIVFLASTIMLSSCQQKKAAEDDFETTVNKVIEAFQLKNDSVLNSLILKNVGLAVIYRLGVFDQYKITDGIDFKQPVPEYLPYPRIDTHNITLSYENLPTFHCGDLKWNKHGLFCDTAKRDNKLLATALNLVKYGGERIAETEIQSFKKLEKNSRRVILADDSGEELIFSLTLIDNKWYLTVLDRATTDCSV